MRHRLVYFATFGVFCAALSTPAAAETVMQQCGHQYQDAKAAGTLNGMSWNQFRSDCATRLKAQPVSATAATPAPAAPATQIANPLNPAPASTPAVKPAAAAPAAPAPTAATTAAAPVATGGRGAFVAREKQCGAEWRANKATLASQTPGITWPKYLSQCNARLKAAAK